MTQIRTFLTRANALAAASTLAFAAVLTAIPAPANALSLVDRSLMVSSTIASDEDEDPNGSTYIFSAGNVEAGDSRNGRKVSHLYTFTVQSTGNLEGFTLEHCETAFAYIGTGACAAVDLLDTTGGFGFTNNAWSGGTVTVRNVTDTTSANFAVSTNAANFMTLTNATGLAADANDVIEIDFVASEDDYFTNPNSGYLATSNGTYFAHIKTFDIDTSATAAFAQAETAIDFVDEGTVTNNITQSINIYTRVQETLNFSVEGDEAENGATPAVGSTQCDPLTASSNIRLGDAGNDALAADTAYTARSYFRLATNASNGTVVYYSGNTLTSGANTITPIGTTPATSAVGTEQFGLTIATGDLDHDFTALTPVVEFDNAAEYAFDATSFNDPQQIATAPGVVACETGAVEYLANISVDTEAGIYTTKINYIAAPSY